MRYHQITEEDRVYISIGRMEGMSHRAIGEWIGRPGSTISREIKRNTNRHGHYRVEKAEQKARNRKSKSRKKPQFTKEQMAIVIDLLKQKWSPEQISGALKLYGLLEISHETIYRYIWADKKSGGFLFKHLRQSGKKRRKRYGAYDSRGKLANKRPISERPEAANDRTEIGHFEIDTVWGAYKNPHSILTLVDRMTGFTYIGKLRNRTTAETNACLLRIIEEADGAIKTITADNGTEFHGYAEVEEETGIKYYFAEPYCSWERGTNENTNGLIRQYTPKGKPMTHLTQADCDSIATRLNHRPRKRHGYLTPEMLYV